MSASEQLSSFTKRETDILLGRIVRDNPYNTDPRDAHLSQLQIVFSVLTDWKVWTHCSMALLSLEYSPPLGTYSPSILKTFRYGTFNSNLLVIPNSALLIITFALAWWSDKVNSRSIPVIFAAIWLLIGLVVLDVSYPPNHSFICKLTKTRSFLTLSPIGFSTPSSYFQEVPPPGIQLMLPGWAPTNLHHVEEPSLWLYTWR
jgi:hypothetical protein